MRRDLIMIWPKIVWLAVLIVLIGILVWSARNERE